MNTQLASAVKLESHYLHGPSRRLSKSAVSYAIPELCNVVDVIIDPVREYGENKKNRLCRSVSLELDAC